MFQPTGFVGAQVGSFGPPWLVKLLFAGGCWVLLWALGVVSLQLAGVATGYGRPSRSVERFWSWLHRGTRARCADLLFVVFVVGSVTLWWVGPVRFAVSQGCTPPECVAAGEEGAEVKRGESASASADPPASPLSFAVTWVYLGVAVVSVGWWPRVAITLALFRTAMREEDPPSKNPPPSECEEKDPAWRSTRNGIEFGYKLIPSQERALDDLCVATADPPKDETVHVTLEGGWGVGKSRVLDALRKTSEASASSDTPADAVRTLHVDVNAWRIVDPLKVEQAIVESVFGSWQVLRHGGWRLRPLWGWFGLWISRVQLVAKSGASQVTLDGLPTPVPLNDADRLRRLARVVRRSGARVLVVVDEVDRCEPIIAQSVLSVLIRSVIQPGIGALVVRVPAQMSDKVRNPVRWGLPDVSASNLAHVYHWCVDGYPNNLSELAQLVAGLREAVDKSVGTADTTDAIARWNANRDVLSKKLDLFLIEQYFRADPATRDTFDTMFEERLQPGAKVLLSALRYTDVAFILLAEVFPSTSAVLRPLTSGECFEGTGLDCEDLERFAYLLATSWSLSSATARPVESYELSLRRFQRWLDVFDKSTAEGRAIWSNVSTSCRDDVVTATQDEA